MDDLITFLRARTEDDRQVAMVASLAPWESSGNDGLVWSARIGDPVSGSTELADAKHISLHDPARVLAEVEAKRGIIDNAEAARDQFHHDGGRDPELELAAATWELALRVLGAAYAGHPDYREDWRPGSTPAWVVDR